MGESQDKQTATKKSSVSSDESSNGKKIPSMEQHLMSNKRDYVMLDLKLSWRQMEILASRLKQWNIAEGDLITQQITA